MNSETLYQFVDNKLAYLLEDQNITGIGVAKKQVEGEVQSDFCISITVRAKAKNDAELESLNTTPIPKFFIVDGEKVPTDIIQRTYVRHTTPADHRRRYRPVQGGTSACTGRFNGSGTLGGFVFRNGKVYALSNWHVFDLGGTIGDGTRQPSPGDSGTAAHKIGVLSRSYLGIDGDCAITELQNVRYNPRILGLNVIPMRTRRAAIGDKVIKSGRTTGVTHGEVSAMRTLNINYPSISGATRRVSVRSFEMIPDSANPAPNNEISMSGDSGALWMLQNEEGNASTTCLGLHFAGVTGATNETANACFIGSVLSRLNVRFQVSYSDPIETLGNTLRGIGSAIF